MMRLYPNRWQLPALALAGSLFFASCERLGGPVVSETRAAPALTSLETESGFEVEITQDSLPSLRIEAEEDFLPHIRTEISNGNLKISLDNGIRYTKLKTRRAYVSMATINGATLSGGSSAHSGQPFTGGAFAANLSGGSKLELSLTCSSYAADLSGGSQATLSLNTSGSARINASGGSQHTFNAGSAGDASIEFSGGSQYNGFELTVNSATVNASGGSPIDIRTNGALRINASGGSTIRYKGTPALDIRDLSGGSQLVNAN